MKILHRDTRIIGTSTDEYLGPELFIDAPPEFGIDDAENYAVIDGKLVETVPQVVTIRQGRLALLQTGLLDMINGVVSQADRATQVDWEYATELRRDWPTLKALQPIIGLTNEQVDDLFRLAAKL